MAERQNSCPPSDEGSDDRGVGRAPQHVELSGHVGGSALDRMLEGWTDEDLKAMGALRDQVRQPEIVEGSAKAFEE